MTKEKSFRTKLFSFIRFVLLMFGWTKKLILSYEQAILYGLSKTKISAKSIGCTHHIRYSDLINSALRSYSQSSNYDKQGVNPLVTVKKS